MTKKTKTVVHPQSKKTVRPEGVSDYKDRYFNWSINTRYLYSRENYVDSFEEMYSLFNSIDGFYNIIKKIDIYRSWTWRMIESHDNKTSCGVMPIEKLDVKSMVTKHFMHVNLTDYEELYKIEINNNHRVWGIRKNDCLFLIWNDPNHFFYKHRNKNYTI